MKEGREEGEERERRESSANNSNVRINLLRSCGPTSAKRAKIHSLKLELSHILAVLFYF